MKRKFLLGLAVLAIVAAACAPEDDTTDEPTDGGTTEPAPVDAADLRRRRRHGERRRPDGRHRQSGVPAMVGGRAPTDANDEWEFNDPYLLEGFEGRGRSAWPSNSGSPPIRSSSCRMPFNKSFAPGPKDFDFVVQQISFSDKRAEAVDFSESYYDVNQALGRVKGSAIEGATTLAELQTAKLGAPLGTTSFDYIEQNIQPTEGAGVYNDLNGAVQALKNGQVDGIVVDLPDRVLRDRRADPQGGLGEFPTVGAQE